jgi:predicted Zn-dependent peptidase
LTPEISCLPNGLRIVSETRPGLETVSVGIWTDVGARHESRRLNGVSHFLEHMLFKGTKSRSAKDIVLDIEAVGGQLNAYTTRDNTTYYARVLKEDLDLALEVLSDMVVNSVCDTKELEREKDVILQEIGQALDTPDDVVFDHLQAVAYGDQAIARPILGEPESIKTFTQEDLLAYLRGNYTGANVVVSAVGNLDHKKLVAAVEARLGGLPRGTKQVSTGAQYFGGRKFEKRELEQIHVAAAWPAYSYHDDEYYALQVYSTILGGGMSSRLFQEVREERGLAYSVYSFSSSHNDTGLFGIYAGTGPALVADLAPVIKKEMESLAKGPEALEFKVAVAQLKASLMMALEATTSRMEQLGRQLLVFDRIIPIPEMLTNVDRVSPDDVARIAQTFASSNQASVAIVGGGNFDSVRF